VQGWKNFFFSVSTIPISIHSFFIYLLQIPDTLRESDESVSDT